MACWRVCLARLMVMKACSSGATYLDTHKGYFEVMCSNSVNTFNMSASAHPT